MTAGSVLLLGMSGPLSVEPLRWLAARTPSLRVAVPAHLLGAALDRAPLPVVSPNPTCAAQARALGVPVVGITREWQQRLAEIEADVLLSACWPWRLPDAVLQAFPGGAYNLHPAPLPRYRGPAPLFWQLRAGETESGMSLHRLSPDFDRGAIIAQARQPIEDRDTEQSLAQKLGSLSAAVLEPWLARLGAPLPGREQDERRSSYQPMPRNEDFSVPVSWPARRAYLFMHGTAARGHPYRIEFGSDHLRARTALRYQVPCPMSQPLHPIPHGVRVQFADGAVDVVPA